MWTVQRTYWTALSQPCRPLDVIGFRQWKDLFRKISDRIVLEQRDFVLNQRDSILRVQSFIHYQLSSPRYRSMWLLSWYKSGYITEHPPHFENPSQFFASGQDKSCSEMLCSVNSFGKCSWCKQNYCFEHIIINTHFCNNYQL